MSTCACVLWLLVISLSLSDWIAAILLAGSIVSFGSLVVT